MYLEFYLLFHSQCSMNSMDTSGKEQVYRFTSTYSFLTLIGNFELHFDFQFLNEDEFFI